MARSNLSTFSQLASPLETAATVPIVWKYMGLSMGVGLLPIPWLDFLGVVGFQMKALKELSALYEVPFAKNRVKNILAVLLSGLGAVFFGRILAQGAAKLIPIVGPALALTMVPFTAGAVTYATGKVFILHFESGGTILNFNPKKVRDYYNEKYEEGLNLASRLRTPQTEIVDL